MSADWSMGYTPSREAPAAAVRRPDGADIPVPGNNRDWWEAQLATSVAFGLGLLDWYPVDGDGARYWGVYGMYSGRPVGIRLARPFERRASESIADEVLTAVEVPVTPLHLGLWVIEAPPKWFRGRRAWALNRPSFSTGDPWFDDIR